MKNKTKTRIYDYDSTKFVLVNGPVLNKDDRIHESILICTCYLLMLPYDERLAFVCRIRDLLRDCTKHAFLDHCQAYVVYKRSEHHILAELHCLHSVYLLEPEERKRIDRVLFDNEIYH